MKAIFFVLILLLCLTACTPQSKQNNISSSSFVSESVSLSESSSSSKNEVQKSDPLVAQFSSELANSEFELSIDFCEDLMDFKPGSTEIREELVSLLMKNEYTTTAMLEHGTLEEETDGKQIQMQLIGTEHWKQITYYLLPESYQEMAGKVYIEIIPSTKEYMGTFGYDGENATCYLYDKEVYQKTNELIRSHNN